MLDTPETVWRIMQHPEFEYALERGVKIQVVLVQAEYPYQQPYLQAIRDALYARQLKGAYKENGVDGVADSLTKTMTRDGRPILREEAIQMAKEGEKAIYGNTVG